MNLAGHGYYVIQLILPVTQLFPLTATHFVSDFVNVLCVLVLLVNKVVVILCEP